MSWIRATPPHSPLHRNILMVVYPPPSPTAMVTNYVTITTVCTVCTFSYSCRKVTHLPLPRFLVIFRLPHVFPIWTPSVSFCITRHWAVSLYLFLVSDCGYPAMMTVTCIFHSFYLSVCHIYCLKMPFKVCIGMAVLNGLSSEMDLADSGTIDRSLKVPVAPYGLPRTHHVASFNGAIYR